MGGLMYPRNQPNDYGDGKSIKIQNFWTTIKVENAAVHEARLSKSCRLFFFKKSPNPDDIEMGIDDYQILYEFVFSIFISWMERATSMPIVISTACQQDKTFNHLGRECQWRII